VGLRPYLVLQPSGQLIRWATVGAAHQMLRPLAIRRCDRWHKRRESVLLQEWRHALAFRDVKPERTMTKIFRSLEFVHRDPRPDLLVVTNMWPEAERPAYGIFVERQVQALQAAGLRCDVLYLRGYVSKLAYVLGILRFLWLTVSARGRYKLIHVHGGETALVARFLLAGPMIATYHGDDILGYKGDDGPISLPSRIRSLVIRYHACLFARTITQSIEMHSRLPARARRSDAIIPCGVDAERFSPADQVEARRQLGWGESERIVLFAATRPYEPRKRFDLAQAAVKRAEAELGQIQLAVAENRPPDSIPVMMNAADCLLLTSMAEGSPVVVKESIMCNLPVVATDVADVREMLDGTEPSAICQHDPSELGDALVDVLRAGRRSNGRTQRTDLDQATTVQRLLGLYACLGLSLIQQARA
jgi:teichuronic acid biosynthesis glycosyltransferase TuaC